VTSTNANAKFSAKYDLDRTRVLFDPAKDITLKQLQEAVARFVDLHGCPACGLNGFELNLARDAVINPIDVNRFEGLGISRVLVETTGLPAQMVTFGR
jgi:hypothetical protein